MADQESAPTRKTRRCQGCIKNYKEFRAVSRDLRDMAKIFGLFIKRGVASMCTVAFLKKRLPILVWLPKYSLIDFQGDLVAGITLGLTVVPQSLAYAGIANLSAVVGLYTSFICCFVYCLFGGVKDNALGPANVMSLLVAQFCAFPGTTSPSSPELAAVMSLITGCIQLAMGFLNLGFILRFVSHTVLSSFIVVAGITIITGQIRNWFGFSNLSKSQDFIHQVGEIFQNLPNTNYRDFLLGLVCILCLFGLKKLRFVKIGKATHMTMLKRVVNKILWIISMLRNVIVIALATVFVIILDKYHISPFALTQNVAAGLPPFKVPSFTIKHGNITMQPSEVIQALGTGLAIIPLIGLLEIIAISRAFGRMNNYKFDYTQEFIVSGIANILGSFFGAYPVTASFSRSSLNSQSGVRTPLGTIYTGVIVVLALAFISSIFHYIPKAALAALIMMAVTDLIDFRILRKLWIIKRIDVFPWLVTLLICFLWTIENGLIIGTVISIIILLYPTAYPGAKIETVEHLCTETSSKSEKVNCQDIVVIQLKQGIVYPAIDYLTDKIEQQFEGGTSKAVIVDFTHVANIDYSTVEGIQAVMEGAHAKGQTVVLCDVKASVLKILTSGDLSHFEVYSTRQEAILSICEENLSDRMSVVGEGEEERTGDKKSRGECSLQIVNGHVESHGATGTSEKEDCEIGISQL